MAFIVSWGGLTLGKELVTSNFPTNLQLTSHYLFKGLNNGCNSPNALGSCLADLMILFSSVIRLILSAVIHYRFLP